MSFRCLGQLLNYLDQAPTQQYISLLKNYKGHDWTFYVMYQPRYPHELKLWKNNAYDLSIVSLFPKQSYTIYKNSIVRLLTGTVTANEQPYVIHDQEDEYNTHSYVTKKKLILTSPHDCTSFFVFKNYKDME